MAASYLRQTNVTSAAHISQRLVYETLDEVTIVRKISVIS